MQNCKKCRIQIQGEKERCPLCGGKLVGEPSERAFPVLPKTKVTRMSFMRVSLFLFCAFETAMIVLGCCLEYWPGWLLLAMVAAVVGIIDISLAVYYRNNLLQLVAVEVYIGLVVTVMVDLFTGRPYWSVNWVLPIAFACLPVATAIIGKASNMEVDDYILYLLFDVIMSTGVQGILLLNRIHTFRYPALISIAFVIVFFLWIIIFNHRELRRETSKLFTV